MKFLIVVLLVMFSMNISAHEGHNSHGGGNPYKEFGIPIEENQAVDFSRSIIDKLVSNKKLTDSWLDVTHVRSEKKVFKTDPEWVVSFKNHKEKEDKATIYIFLSLYGDFLGANFTGN